MVKSNYEKIKRRYPLLAKKVVADAYVVESLDRTDIYIRLQGGVELQITEWMENGKRTIEVLSNYYCRKFCTIKATNEFLKETIKY